MSAPYGCFDHIIGLSRTDCPCLQEDKPEDADESASGYYIDEGPWLNMDQLKNATTCPEFWDWLERARTLAIKDYKRDVLSCIRQKTTYAREPLSSIIGDPDTNRVITTSNTYVGMTVQTAHVVGGTMTVKRIGLKLDTTGPIDVEVHSREGLLATYQVQAVAGQVSWHTLSAPLELDMSTESSSNPRYWFLWAPSGQKPYNVKLHCGCPNGQWKPYWDSGYPYYESKVKRNGFEWTQWVMAGGTKGDDLNTREDWKVGSTDTYGVLVDASWKCDASTTICFDDPDYTDPLYLQQAAAILNMAWWYLLSFIRNSSNPSFWTLLNSEGIDDNKNKVFTAYSDAVAFVCEEFSKQENINLNGDCLSCKDEWGMSVKLIKT